MAEPPNVPPRTANGRGDRLATAVATDEAPAERWPNAALKDETAEAAAIARMLLPDESAWVHRRVEHVHFLDSGRVRRRMSIDFTPPLLATEADGRPQTRTIQYLPITVLRKRRLLDLDVTDEDGRPLPLLTISQNALIAHTILNDVAADALGGVVSDDASKLLAKVAGLGGEVQPDDEARLAMSRSAMDEFELADPATEFGQIWGNSTAQNFIRLLCENFIFFVERQFDPLRRRVLKIAYETMIDRSLAPRPAWYDRLREQFGLRTYAPTIDTPGVYAATSYHLEVEPPEETSIVVARLLRLRLRFGEVADKPVSEIVIDSQPARERIHLMGAIRLSEERERRLFVTRQREEARADFEFVLRLGSVLPVFVSCLLTTLTFAGGLALHYAKHSHPSPEASAALIVGLPVFYAAYVSAGNHRLAKAMLIGLRGLAFASALLSFVGACSIAVSLSSRVRLGVWWSCETLSIPPMVIAGFALLHSYTKIRRRQLSFRGAAAITVVAIEGYLALAWAAYRPAPGWALALPGLLLVLLAIAILRRGMVGWWEVCAACCLTLAVCLPLLRSQNDLPLRWGVVVLVLVPLAAGAVHSVTRGGEGNSRALLRALAAEITTAILLVSGWYRHFPPWAYVLIVVVVSASFLTRRSLGSALGRSASFLGRGGSPSDGLGTH